VADQLDRNLRSRQLRRLLVEVPPPRPEAVVGLLGAWPPWPTLWELTRGPSWRPLLELRGQADPTTDPVLSLLLLARASEAVGDVAGAEALLRRATAARPEQVVLLDALGRLLERRGRAGEAVECFRAARALRPQLGVALGRVLVQAGRGTEGEAVLRDLVHRQPNNPELHCYLGNALYHQKKLDEAVAAFRKAIALKPDDALAYNNLGATLSDQKKLDEAVAAYRKAIALQPDDAKAYYNLGLALYFQKKLDEAVAAFQKADRLLPNHPVIRNNLRRTQQLLDLDRKLVACLAGKDRPGSPREAVALAAFCAGYRERYHAAVRFYADAFRDDPSLADNPHAVHRYNAACSAAHATAGQGRDAATLAEGDRAGLRRQALAWLRADLDAWRHCIRDGNPRDRGDADAALRHWQGDTDLSRVRHPWLLLRLPADERRRWQTLWADVEALLQKARKTGI
jgi:Flp pilus assembly protein TadD